MTGSAKVRRIESVRIGLLGVLLAAAAVVPSHAAAQLPVQPLAVEHGFASEGTERYRDPPVNVEGKYVVISLSEHRLYLMEESRVLWSAIVGTGTGTRLEGAGQRWDFSTPRGMFRVQRKEKNPRWYVPDWRYVERKEPVPDANDPKRWEVGMLGTSALFLGEGIAVHGTNSPELLGQDVSHGCIRMANEAARYLYHQVDVGTPVFIY